MRRRIVLIALLSWGCGGSTGDPAQPEPQEGPGPGPGCEPGATDWTIWVTNQAEDQDTVTVFHNHGDEQVQAEILATIPVGRGPHNVVFSPDRRRAYVANLGSPPENGSVSVIDTGSYEVLATLEAGVKAHGLQVTPDGRWVWVANVSSNDVTVIDAGALAVEPERIAAGEGPALVAFTPDGAKAYVSNGKAGTTSVVDVASRRVTKTLRTGAGAMGLVVRQDGRYVFETEGEDDKVSVIDTATDEVAGVILAGTEPHGIALAGNELLITNRSGDSVAFVDASTFEVVGSVAVPGRPDIVAVSPSCDRAYMTLRDVVGVAVVDVHDRRLLDVIGLGSGDVHGIGVLAGVP